jgi:hypothetical protein
VLPAANEALAWEKAGLFRRLSDGITKAVR